MSWWFNHNPETELNWFILMAITTFFHDVILMTLCDHFMLLPKIISNYHQIPLSMFS